MQQRNHLSNLNYTTMSTITTQSPLTDSQLNELIDKHPMYKKFRQYYGMSQEGKNDYEVGCIQTANAMMPIILELILGTNKLYQSATKSN